MEFESMTDSAEQATFNPFLIARSDHACFGCGDDNPIGLRLRFSPDGDGVKAPFVPETEHQGFHNVVHGGIISTVLDEAMAWATARAGFWAVTGEMRIRFRQPLALGEPTTVTARVSGSQGRLVTTTAELSRDRDCSAIATASATFVKVDATTEAAWRARYVRGSGVMAAEARENPSNSAELE
jgi:acyl-coenzyme A thioesterase PaaI-like protein